MPKYRRRFPVKLRESAAMATAERVEIREAPVAGAVTPGSKGRMLIQLISEGIGTSGAYPSTTLIEAARRRVFAAGTHVFMDHGTATEEVERPERSVRDLAAVLTEDARWEPSSKALVAEAQVFTPFRERMAELAPHIGLSIKASGLAEHGEFGGQPTMIVTEIRSAQSVDFVTRAGRGGKVLALLESARAELREAPTEQIRAVLDRAIRSVYPDGHIWVRDFDHERGICWFEAGHGGETATWEVRYLPSPDSVQLIHGRTQVVAETVYRPVDTAATDPMPMAYAESAAEVAALRAANPAPATEDPDGTPPAEKPTTKEGPAMSGDQTGGTPASAGTTATTSTELAEAATARDAAIREAAEAKAELARYKAARKAAEQAAPIVDRILAESGLPVAAVARVRTGVLGQVPLTEAGHLDETRLRTLAEAETTAEQAYLAQLAESAGAGKVSGFGATSAPQQAAAPNVAPWAQADPEPDTALIESYRRRGLNLEAATAAARGRAI